MSCLSVQIRAAGGSRLAWRQLLPSEFIWFLVHRVGSESASHILLALPWVQWITVGHGHEVVRCVYLRDAGLVIVIGDVDDLWV